MTVQSSKPLKTFLEAPFSEDMGEFLPNTLGLEEGCETKKLMISVV